MNIKDVLDILILILIALVLILVCIVMIKYFILPIMISSITNETKWLW